jgi:hypothetical protein
MGTAGCNFMSPTATAIQYDPSDGIGATIGELKVRNAILLSDRDDPVGSLVVSLVNLGESGKKVLIQYTNDSGETVDETVIVGSGERESFGNTDQDQILFDDVDAQPGDLFPVFITYGDESGQVLLVPILDGTLPQYTDLVPTSSD